MAGWHFLEYCLTQATDEGMYSTPTLVDLILDGILYRVARFVDVLGQFRCAVIDVQYPEVDAGCDRGRQQDSHKQQRDENAHRTLAAAET